MLKYEPLYFRLRRVFKENGISFRDRKLLVDLLERSGRKFKRGLDVGCGDCEVILSLVNKGIVQKGYGIDVIRSYYGSKIEFIIANAERQFPFDDNFFDLVLCLHLLEHLRNPMRCISEMYRVLEHGGVLAIIVPLEIIKGITTLPDSIFEFLHNGYLIAPCRVHMNSFSKRKILKLLNKFEWRKILIKEIPSSILHRSLLVLAIK